MSRVIRAHTNQVISHHVVDARKKAEQILEAARKEASQIIENARRDANQLREQAYQSGKEQGKEEIAALLIKTKKALAQKESTHEQDFLRLALVAAERLVHTELELKPERIQNIAKDVLLRAGRAREITLNVHPTDFAVLENNPEFFEFRIVKNESLTRGDCFVETELGVFDGRLKIRIETLRNALKA